MKKKLLIIFCILIILAIALCIYLYNTLDAFRPYNFPSNQKLMIVEHYHPFRNDYVYVEYYIFNKKDECTACFIAQNEPEEGSFDITSYPPYYINKKNKDGIQYSEFIGFRGYKYDYIKEYCKQSTNIIIREF